MVGLNGALAFLVSTDGVLGATPRWHLSNTHQRVTLLHLSLSLSMHTLPVLFHLREEVGPRVLVCGSHDFVLTALGTCEESPPGFVVLGNA